MPANRQKLPPSDALDTLPELERNLKSILPGALVRSRNGFRDSDIYLAPSWLQAIHVYIRRQTGDTKHDNRLTQPGQRQLLVAIGNRLELDVETLLQAVPDAEVRTIYVAIRRL